jgi:hypothetical protein
MDDEHGKTAVIISEESAFADARNRMTVRSS